MEELFKDLAWKCYQNRLFMTVYSDRSLDVNHHKIEDGKIVEATNVSSAILEDYSFWETPEDALKRVHKEVDDFLEGGE